MLIVRIAAICKQLEHTRRMQQLHLPTLTTFIIEGTGSVKHTIPGISAVAAC